MAFNYFTLWNEINTDPISRGYSGMSNASVAGNMNIANRTVNKTLMEQWHNARVGYPSIALPL